MHKANEIQSIRDLNYTLYRFTRDGSKERVDLLCQTLNINWKHIQADYGHGIINHDLYSLMVGRLKQAIDKYHLSHNAFLDTDSILNEWHLLMIETD